jgi:hypothetical protein
MQDLFQNYVSDLIKFRDSFHEELRATAAELSKAMTDYSQRSEAVLISFMEKVSARGEALEAAAAARFDLFRGLPAKGGLPNVSDPPLAPANADQVRIAAVAERAVADGLFVESEADRKLKSVRPMLLVKSDPAA